MPTLGAGGAESVMITLANEWAERCEVYFLVGSAVGEFKAKVSEKINLINLNSSKFSYSIFKIVHQLRVVKPDVVISTLIYCNVITTVATLSSFIKTKLILREATTPTRDLVGKSKLLYFLVGYLYKYASLIIAGSNGVKQDLIIHFGIDEKLIEVIDNPIISQELIKLSLDEFEHPFFSNKSDAIILSVGKVSEAKDYLTLLKAYNIVRSVVPSKLIIVGNKFENSTLFHQLIDFIESNNLVNDIDFVGFQNNPFKYMKKADVFVLSSKYEGSPGVLVQGLSINGNVVSTDCKSGPTEILENGKYGRLVPVGNYKLMADAIIDAIKYPYQFKDAPTLKNFGVEISSEKYFKAINS